MLYLKHMNNIRSQLSHSTRQNKPREGRNLMLTDDYLVGLTDGEGCFHVYVKKKKDDGTGNRVVPMFVVKLKASDKQVLYQIKDYLGFGVVYIQRDRRKNHSTCYRYQASRFEDVKKIIKFFRENPLRSNSKRNDFQLFSKIMELIEKKDHHTKNGLNKIIYLKNQMH